MAADVVFDRLLPHLRTKTAQNEISNLIPAEGNWNIFRIKLKNLSDRIVAVEKANDRRKKYAKHLEQLISSWNEADEGFMDLSESIKHANITLQKVSDINYNYPVENSELRGECLYSGEHRPTDPEFGGNKMHDSFYSTLNSEFDLSLKTKLNHKRPLSTFPSLQEELKAQRNEFWNSLVENNYIIPPTPSSSNEPPVLPNNEQEVVNSKCLVNDYCIINDKISKETHSPELLDENSASKLITSDIIYPMHEAKQINEEGGDITDKDLM